MASKIRELVKEYVAGAETAGKQTFKMASSVSWRAKSLCSYAVEIAYPDILSGRFIVNKTKYSITTTKLQNMLMNELNLAGKKFTAVEEDEYIELRKNI